MALKGAPGRHRDTRNHNIQTPNKNQYTPVIKVEDSADTQIPGKKPAGNTKFILWVLVGIAIAITLIYLAFKYKP